MAVHKTVHSLTLDEAKHLVALLQDAARQQKGVELDAAQATALERLLTYVGAEHAFPALDVDLNMAHALTVKGRKARYPGMRGLRAFTRDTEDS